MDWRITCWSLERQDAEEELLCLPRCTLVHSSLFYHRNAQVYHSNNKRDENIYQLLHIPCRWLGKTNDGGQSGGTAQQEDIAAPRLQETATPPGLAGLTSQNFIGSGPGRATV